MNSNEFTKHKIIQRGCLIQEKGARLFINKKKKG
jgi:hypothetical protein